MKYLVLCPFLQKTLRFFNFIYNEFLSEISDYNDQIWNGSIAKESNQWSTAFTFI